VARVKRLQTFLRRWITVLIPVAIVVLTAGSGATNGHYHLFGHRFAVSWTLIVVAAVLGVVEAVVVARRQLRVKALEAAASGLEARAVAGEESVIALMRAELLAIQDRARQFSSERVSLFRCDGDHFILVGRRSPCPPFDESLGRDRYPLDQGVLGAAWQNNVAGEPSLPAAGPTSDPPRRRWLDAQMRLGVPEEVARSFTMRSQAYAAFRIQERDRALGVIVFESTVSVTDAAGAGQSPTKRRADELEPIVKEAGERLADLLRASAYLPPDRVRELLERQQGAASRSR
jgi:hypothetical protein